MVLMYVCVWHMHTLIQGFRYHMRTHFIQCNCKGLRALGYIPHTNSLRYWKVGNKASKWTSFHICLSVLQSTELFMLQDQSADFEETWRFLSRRFEDVKLVGSTLSGATSLSQGNYLPWTTLAKQISRTLWSMSSCWWLFNRLRTRENSCVGRDNVIRSCPFMFQLR